MEKNWKQAGISLLFSAFCLWLSFLLFMDIKVDAANFQILSVFYFQMILCVALLIFYKKFVRPSLLSQFDSRTTTNLASGILYISFVIRITLDVLNQYSDDVLFFWMTSITSILLVSLYYFPKRRMFEAGLGLLIVFQAGPYQTEKIAPLLPIHLFFIIVVIHHLVESARRNEKAFILTDYLWPVLIFLLSIGLSTATSKVTAKSIPTFLYLCEMAVLMIIVGNYIHSSAEAIRIFAVPLFHGLMMAVSMFWKIFLRVEAMGIREGLFHRMWVSETPPNSIGFHILMVIPFLCAALFKYTDKKIRIVIHLSVLIMGAAVFFSFSVGAWLALMSEFLLFYLLIRSKLNRSNRVSRKIPLLYPLPFIILFISFFFIKFPGINLFFSEMEISSAHKLTTFLQFFRQEAAEKTSFWAGALSNLKSSPFIGIGPSTLKFAFPYKSIKYTLSSGAAAATLYNSGNMYVDILVYSGLLGIVTFFVLIAKTLYEFWKAKKRYPIPFLHIASFTALVGFLIQGLDDSRFFERDGGFLVWLPFAAALWSSRHSKIEKRKESLFSRAKRFETFLIIPVAVAVLLSQFSLQASDLLKKQAVESVHPDKVPETKHLLSKALSFNRFDPHLYFLMSAWYKYYSDDLNRIELEEYFLKKALHYNPNNPLYHIRIAKFYKSVKDYDMARQHLVAAAELNPFFVDHSHLAANPYLELGLLDLAAEKPEEALYHFKQCIIYAPELFNRIIEMLETNRQTPEPAEFLIIIEREFYIKLLDEPETGILNYQQLIKCARMLDEPAISQSFFKKYYNRLSQLDTSDFEIHSKHFLTFLIQQIDYLRRQSEFDFLEKMLAELLQAHPERGVIWNEYGILIFLKSDNDQAAAAAFEKGMKYWNSVTVDNYFACMILRLLYVLLEQPEKSREMLSMSRFVSQDIDHQLWEAGTLLSDAIVEKTHIEQLKLMVRALRMSLVSG